MEVWLEGLDYPLLPVMQVFKNRDGAVDWLYLVCSDLSLSYEQITTIYKKVMGRRRIPKICKE
ncbi:MAG: hypothetical protein AB7S54_00685 [Bacteroidales bacterium]